MICGSTLIMFSPIFMRMIPQYFRTATLNTSLNKIYSRLYKNFLFGVNLKECCKTPKETKVMLITTSQKRLHLHDNVLNLTFNNDTLKNVDNDKVLGVHIDNNLTWSIHIQFMVKKISSNLWLLSKLSIYPLSIEFNFIKHTFNPTLITVPQYGDKHRIPTSTESTGYKSGLLKSF